MNTRDRRCPPENAVMKTYTVTTREKGAPELEQHGIKAVNPISAKRQAIANALIMGWKHPRVTRCQEAAA